MPEKERIGLAQARTLAVGGVKLPAIASGQVNITGSATVALPAGLGTVGAMIATLNAAPVSGAAFVTATVVGSTMTLSVWQSSLAASTTATAVSWAAFGS